MNFIQSLVQSIKDKRLVVCMGLDSILDRDGEIKIPLFVSLILKKFYLNFLFFLLIYNS